MISNCLLLLMALLADYTSNSNYKHSRVLSSTPIYRNMPHRLLLYSLAVLYVWHTQGCNEQIFDSMPARAILLRRHNTERLFATARQRSHCRLTVIGRHFRDLTIIYYCNDNSDPKLTTNYSINDLGNK
jgi:hypothetical protein